MHACAHRRFLKLRKFCLPKLSSAKLDLLELFRPVYMYRSSFENECSSRCQEKMSHFPTRTFWAVSGVFSFNRTTNWCRPSFSWVWAERDSSRGCVPLGTKTVSTETLHRFTLKSFVFTGLKRQKWPKKKKHLEPCSSVFSVVRGSCQFPDKTQTHTTQIPEIRALTSLKYRLLAFFV